MTPRIVLAFVAAGLIAAYAAMPYKPVQHTRPDLFCPDVRQIEFVPHYCEYKLRDA